MEQIRQIGRKIDDFFYFYLWPGEGNRRELVFKIIVFAAIGFFLGDMHHSVDPEIVGGAYLFLILAALLAVVSSWALGLLALLSSFYCAIRFF